MIEVHAHGATDVGRRREVNEDSFHLGRGLFFVADGMGGHHAGDVASRLTVAALGAVDDRTVSETTVAEGIGRANHDVLDYAAGHPGSEGMGTTLAGVALLHRDDDPTWMVFNVGDSRVYLFADGQLRQVTVDHSEVEEMVAAGQLSREQARHHRLRNVITRSVGELPPAQVDIAFLPCRSDQRLVICTDGLSTEVEDVDIEQIVAGSPTVEAAVESLLERALDHGGRDNVTVIVVQVAGADVGADEVSTTVPRGLIERETVV